MLRRVVSTHKCYKQFVGKKVADILKSTKEAGNWPVIAPTGQVDAKDEEEMSSEFVLEAADNLLVPRAQC